MNPSSSNETNPGLQPAQPVEQATGPGTAAETGPPNVPEQGPAGAEQASTPPQAPPAAAVPPIALPALPLPPPVPQGQASTPLPQTSSLGVVDDGDLIEKEWVNKAKQIVEQTRDDPYKQSEELTVFRAEYMKKRYDKNIKLSK